VCQISHSKSKLFSCWVNCQKLKGAFYAAPCTCTLCTPMQRTRVGATLGMLERWMATKHKDLLGTEHKRWVTDLPDNDDYHSRLVVYSASATGWQRSADNAGLAVVNWYRKTAARVTRSSKTRCERELSEVEWTGEQYSRSSITGMAGWLARRRRSRPAGRRQVQRT